MERYQITDLERLTGIKAHTIRIWEKRYGLIAPNRTATNIRYYDDDQLRMLLNVSSLLENGYKISAVAAMNTAEIEAVVNEICSIQQKPTDAICSVFINNLVSATVSYNEAAFERIFSASLTRFGMHNTMVQVIYPYLTKVGILWRIDHMTSVQEHFASNLLRRKIIAAIDGLPMPDKTTKKFLLALPPDEWHEIGLLLSDYIIRAAGYASIYLGQSVPYKKLGAIITETKPTHLLTFYISCKWNEKQLAQLQEFQELRKGLRILVGGNKHMLEQIIAPESFAYLLSTGDLSIHL